MTYSLKHFRNSFCRGKICMFSFNARTVLGQKDTKISTLLTRCPEDYCSSASLHWTCHLGELESLAQVSVSFCCFTVAKQLHFMSSRNTNENSNSDSTLNSSIMSVFCFVLLQSRGRAHLPKLKSHNQQNSSSSKEVAKTFSLLERCAVQMSAKGRNFLKFTLTVWALSCFVVLRTTWTRRDLYIIKDPIRPYLSLSYTQGFLRDDFSVLS